jgi:hypothetical protein
MTLSIMTLSRIVECCYVVPFMLTIVYAECHKLAIYAECHYADCRYSKCRGTQIFVFNFISYRFIL